MEARKEGTREKVKMEITKKQSITVANKVATS